MKSFADRACSDIPRTSVPARHIKSRQLCDAKLNLHIAPLCDLLCIFNSLRRIRKKLRHLFLVTSHNTGRLHSASDLRLPPSCRSGYKAGYHVPPHRPQLRYSAQSFVATSGISSSSDHAHEAADLPACCIRNSVILQLQKIIVLSKQISGNDAALPPSPPHSSPFIRYRGTSPARQALSAMMPSWYFF